MNFMALYPISNYKGHVLANCPSVTEHSPGANANMAKDSPEEATEVTRARRLEKYWARMVTVGRKVRQ